MTKAIGGTATNFLYAGPNVVQELSGNIPTANLLVGELDEIFTRTDSAGRVSFLSDFLSSTVALTDSTPSATTQYTYEPFGTTTTSGSTNGNSFQYTGRENDSGALYFYRSRYYNSQLSRFISEDPIGLRGGANLYSYVGNRPTGLSDPMGTDRHDPLCPPAMRHGNGGPGSGGAGPGNGNGNGGPGNPPWPGDGYNGPISAGVNGPGIGLRYTLDPPTNTFYITFTLGIGTGTGGSAGPVRRPPTPGVGPLGGSLCFSSPGTGGWSGCWNNAGNPTLGAGPTFGNDVPLGWPPIPRFGEPFTFPLTLWPDFCAMEKEQQ